MLPSQQPYPSARRTTGQPKNDTKAETMISQDSIDKFLQSLRVAAASDHTVRAYRSDLMGFLKWLPQPAPLTWEDTELRAAAYLTTNSPNWKPRTTLRKLSALRTWADYHGQHEFLMRYKGPRPADLVPHPIPEGIEGVRAMIASVATIRNGRKLVESPHRALIVLTGLLGLRVEEAVTVTWEDCTCTSDGWTLTIRGKGNAERVIPITDEAWSFLKPSYERAWIATDKRLVPMSNSGARASLKRHGERAGLSRPVSSHDMRMTAATAFYAVDNDLRAVQSILGHRSVQTTVGYTGIGMAAQRKAMQVS